MVKITPQSISIHLPFTFQLALRTSILPLGQVRAYRQDHVPVKAATLYAGFREKGRVRRREEECVKPAAGLARRKAGPKHLPEACVCLDLLGRMKTPKEAQAAATFCLPPLAADTDCPGRITKHAIGTAQLKDF